VESFARVAASDDDLPRSAIGRRSPEEDKKIRVLFGRGEGFKSAGSLGDFSTNGLEMDPKIPINKRST
jgi:hypothetical protein